MVELLGRLATDFSYALADVSNRHLRDEACYETTYHRDSTTDQRCGALVTGGEETIRHAADPHRRCSSRSNRCRARLERAGTSTAKSRAGAAGAVWPLVSGATLLVNFRSREPRRAVASPAATAQRHESLRVPKRIA